MESIEEFRINFHRIFQIFSALSNQSNRKFSNRIERILNELQFIPKPQPVIYNLCLCFYSLEQPLERVEQSAGKLSIWTRA